jgi:hypothetical protein
MCTIAFVARATGALRATAQIAAVCGVLIVAANLSAQAYASQATTAAATQGGQMARGDEQSEFIFLPAYTILAMEAFQDEVGLTGGQLRDLREIGKRAEQAANAVSGALPLLGSDEERRAYFNAKQLEIKESVRKQIEAALTPAQVAAVKNWAFLHNGEMWLNDQGVREAVGVTASQAKAIARVWDTYYAQSRAHSEKDIDKAFQLLDTRQRQAVRAEVKKLYRSLYEDTQHYATRPGAATYVSRFHLQVWADPISNPRPSSFFLPEYDLLCWPGNSKKLKVTDEQMSKLLEISARYAAVEREFGTERDNAKMRRTRDKAVAQVRRDVESVLSSKQIAALDEMIFGANILPSLTFEDVQTALGMTAAQIAAIAEIRVELKTEIRKLDRKREEDIVAVLSEGQVQRLRKELEKRNLP